MAEYIEREAAEEAAMGACELYPSECDMIGCAVDKIPAADVAPVVHGRWLPEHHKDKVSQTEYHSYIWYHCSECGRRLIGCRDTREAPYCHCGAKMDLRGENDDGSEKA